MMVTFNTVMSLAYGPPALLGLVVRRTPSWSGLASFAVALAVGVFGTFVLGLGPRGQRGRRGPGLGRGLLPEPALPGERPRPRRAARRLSSVASTRRWTWRRSSRDTHDPTAQVFRFLSRATGLVGLLCVPLVFTAPADERATAIGYVAITLALAGALTFVKGKAPEPSPVAVEDAR